MSQRLLIPLAFLAFVSLGLPDALLGVAWPTMRTTFARPIGSLGLVAACGTAGYFTTSFFAGAITQRIGVGRLLGGSCAVVALALGVYATSPLWAGILIAAFFAGIGAGAIDGGLNAFAAGAFSARVLNWLHACWGVGATVGPLAMTAAVECRLGWRLGYAAVGSAIALLALIFTMTRTRWHAGSTAAAATERPASIAEALADPRVLANVTFFFLYGCLEFGVGNWLFTFLTTFRGAKVGAAGGAVGLYFASITIGRVAFGQLAHVLGPVTALRLGLAGAVVGASLLMQGFPVGVALASPAILGFAIAPLFPTMIALTTQRVGGRLAAQSVAFQVSACSLGVAAGSATIGLLAQSFGIGLLPYALLVLIVALATLHESIHCIAAEKHEVVPQRHRSA